MLPVLPKLLQLQERDQLLRKMQRELDSMPKMQAAARAQLAGDTTAVEKATLGVQEVEMAIKSLELDVGTRQTSIKRLQDQQFETRKNDEFRALGTEVERYQREVSELEDRELEQMERLEAAKAVLAAARAKLGQTQSRVNDELAELEERMVAMRKRVETVTAEREALAGPIDPEALELYDRLFKKKGDAAVVPVTGANCGGCHMKMVTGTIQNLKQDEVITQCDSCGRILYFAE